MFENLSQADVYRCMNECYAVARRLHEGWTLVADSSPELARKLSEAANLAGDIGTAAHDEFVSRGGAAAL
jgi:hypothetical protein